MTLHKKTSNLGIQYQVNKIKIAGHSHQWKLLEKLGTSAEYFSEIYKIGVFCSLDFKIQRNENFSFPHFAFLDSSQIKIFTFRNFWEPPAAELKYIC